MNAPPHHQRSLSVIEDPPAPSPLEPISNVGLPVSLQRNSSLTRLSTSHPSALPPSGRSEARSPIAPQPPIAPSSSFGAEYDSGAESLDSGDEGPEGGGGRSAQKCLPCVDEGNNDERDDAASELPAPPTRNAGGGVQAQAGSEPRPPSSSSPRRAGGGAAASDKTMNVFPSQHLSRGSVLVSTAPASSSSSSSPSPSSSSLAGNLQSRKDVDASGGSARRLGEREDEPVALTFSRSLMFYGYGTVTEENVSACQLLCESRKLRKKYHRGLGVDSKLLQKVPCTRYSFGHSGVLELFGDVEAELPAVDASADFTASANPLPPQPLVTVPTIFEFMKDYNRIVRISNDGATRSFSFQRLQLLSAAFKTHILTNGQVENEAQSSLLGTDFYRTPKVDNHIHLAAAASAKQFVDFVRDKLTTEPDTVVLEEGDTLKEVFDKAKLDADHLTIDAFNVLADYSVYQRFDNFNSKYSPFKLAQMRRIFLKVDNAIDGRYFAELTKIVLARHEAAKGHESLTEMRLSIYGMESNEWQQCAKWVLRNWEGRHPGPVLSDKNRWIVQIPRLWRIYKNKHKDSLETTSFQNMLEFIFKPVIDATLHPEKPENAEVAELLKHVVGFDSVDDEGNAEGPCVCTFPKDWTGSDNPSYAWQLYYLWANITVINKLRRSKGLNTFAFRPHAGETGDVNHLAATYLLCPGINHGINLDKQVTLQYLYYLDQVGLSISPLSNNFLFRKMKDSPFNKFFRRGMNVALSTDDPLLFHMSDDPLLEEYSVARATFDLSMTDLCEIARNSILQSGFEGSKKRAWLGEHYKKGVKHCEENKTHVPFMRSKFRAEHLAQEHMLMKLLAAEKGDEVLKQMMNQYDIARSGHNTILRENKVVVPDGDTVWKAGIGTESRAKAGYSSGEETD